MAPLDRLHTASVLDEITGTSDGAGRGRLLEDLAADLFCAIPGVVLRDRDRLSNSGNEELDLAFSNAADVSGLFDFGRDVLVECKSQGRPVDAQAVNWFATKMRRRRQDLGVLLAVEGVTGRPDGARRAARAEIEHSALEGQMVLVVIGDELRYLSSGEHFAALLQAKRARLLTTRSMLLADERQLADLDSDGPIHDSARLLLHPATNLAHAEADSWRRGLDAMRLALRRHRARALDDLEARRPVLSNELRPGVDGLREALPIIRDKLVALETVIDEYMADTEGDQRWRSARDAAVDLGAACIDLLRLDPSAVGAPNPDLVAINVETFAPNRLRASVGSRLWTTLTRYYLEQIETVGEQLRETSMYALLSLVIDELLILDEDQAG